MGARVLKLNKVHLFAQKLANIIVWRSAAPKVFLCHKSFYYGINSL